VTDDIRGVQLAKNDIGLVFGSASQKTVVFGSVLRNLLRFRFFVVFFCTVLLNMYGICTLLSAFQFTVLS